MPDARFALVLHGKIGSFQRAGGSSGRAVDDAPPSLDVLVFAWQSVVRHLGSTLDVFGHSWSPSVGAAVDALLQLRGSSHQPEEIERNRQICTELVAPLLGLKHISYEPVGRGHSSCERTASQMLSMRRAIQLKQMHEHRRRAGVRYAGVLVSRWDIAWSSPFALEKLRLAPNSFVLPQACASTNVLDTPEYDLWRARVCGRERHTPSLGALGQRGETARALLVDDAGRRIEGRTQQASPGHSSRGALRAGSLRGPAHGVWMSDLIFASGSAEADAFAQAGGARTFANLTAAHVRTLTPNAARAHTGSDGGGASSHLIYGHTIWGLHILHGLRANLAYAPVHLGVDFSLARYWWRDHCRALQPTCRGDRCTARDLRRRSWHANLGEAPLRRAGELAPEWQASGQPRSCSDGYFYCARGSRMCTEERLHLGQGLDTQEARAVYSTCSERLCAAKGVAPESAACAGWLLSLLLEVSAAVDLIGAGRSNHSSMQQSLAAAPGAAGGAAASAAATARLAAQAHELLHGASMPRAAWRATCPDLGLLPRMLRASIGYCDATDDNEGDCERGSKGSFRLAAGAVVNDHTSCIERCRQCGRCNFVSISVINGDCSWFHECRTPVGLAMGGKSYLTFAVSKT